MTIAFRLLTIARKGRRTERNCLDTDARTPFVVQYGDEDAGKTAYYIARWVNNEGKGPWSETVSATIAG